MGCAQLIGLPTTQSKSKRIAPLGGAMPMVTLRMLSSRWHLRLRCCRIVLGACTTGTIACDIMATKNVMKCQYVTHLQHLGRHPLQSHHVCQTSPRHHLTSQRHLLESWFVEWMQLMDVIPCMADVTKLAMVMDSAWRCHIATALLAVAMPMATIVIVSGACLTFGNAGQSITKHVIQHQDAHTITRRWLCEWGHL